MPEQPTITLRDGHAIPQLGFGVFGTARQFCFQWTSAEVSRDGGC